MTTTLNILSILLSIAMMLTGATGPEADAPMASTLTVGDVYLEYNDVSFELAPSLTAGVMTEDGTAVFDLSMQSGEESLFPMQLVVTEEAATLVMEKTGKAFTIDADTLNGIVAEALDLDELMPEEMIGELVSEFQSGLNLTMNGVSVQMDAENAATLMEKIAEKLVAVETVDGVDGYDDEEYQVKTSRYELNNDQFFEIVDIVIESDEAVKAQLEESLAAANAALAESEMGPVSSLKELYGMAGVTLKFDMTESVSEDGLFDHVSGAVTMSVEGLPEDFVITFDLYDVNGMVEATVETHYAVDGEVLNVGFFCYADEAEVFFEAVFEIMPEDTDALADEDYEDAVSLYVSGGAVPGEDGGMEFGLNIEMGTYNEGLAFMIDGFQDEEGDIDVAVDFEYADDVDTIACGLTLGYSDAVFANAAEGLEAIMVDPENMEGVQAEIEAVADSLMADVEALVAEESVVEMIAALEAIDSAEMDADDEIELDYDEEMPVNTELSFEEPALGYIPANMAIDEYDVDVEYDSVSITVADADYENVYYIYIYGDIYTSDRASYVLAEDGALSAFDNPIVTVDTEEDAIYAEMEDGALTINITYFGEEMGVEEIGKILSAMTY